jgi:hypothetical protein
MTAATIKTARTGTRAGEPAGAGLVITRGRREDSVRCGCGELFLRPKGETYTACLACESGWRLAQAGISPDDPALRQLAEYNAAVFARAARLAAQAARVAPAARPKAIDPQPSEPDEGVLL